jgi:hypothetical protein
MTRIEDLLERDAHAWQTYVDNAVPAAGATAGVRRSAAREGWRTAAAVLVAASSAAITIAVIVVTRDNSAHLPAAAPPPSQLAHPNLQALTQRVPCPAKPTTTLDSPSLKAFQPVTALVCLTDVRTFPGEGQWEVVVRQIAVAGVNDLHRAFEQPNLPRSTGTCGLVAVNSPPVALVAASGSYLIPTGPRDGCGEPLRLTAMQSVQWQDVTVTKQRQLVTPEAMAAGCEMRWKNVAYLYQQSPSRLSPGGQLFPSAPATLKVCYYQTPASDPDIGTFVRGITLDAQRTTQLLAALTGPASDAACQASRAFVVITASNAAAAGPWAGVELGGCSRVARSYPKQDFGSANPGVVQSILGSG